MAFLNESMYVYTFKDVVDILNEQTTESYTRVHISVREWDHVFSIANLFLILVIEPRSK